MSVVKDEGSVAILIDVVVGDDSVDGEVNGGPFTSGDVDCSLAVGSVGTLG